MAAWPLKVTCHDYFTPNLHYFCVLQFSVFVFCPLCCVPNICFSASTLLFSLFAWCQNRKPSVASSPCRKVKLWMLGTATVWFLNIRAPEHNSERPVLDHMLIVGCYGIVTDVGELTWWLWGFWGTAHGDNCIVWGRRITATHSIIVAHLHINWGHRHNAQHAFMCIYRLRADLKGAIRGRSYVAAIHPSSHEELSCQS